jgi:hypothetical protein
MTIESEANKITYPGDDSQTGFDFTFTIAEPNVGEANDLAVWKIDSAGAPSLLTEGTGTNEYSVAVTLYPGAGTVTFPASGSGTLATGEYLVIVRHQALFQETLLSNQGGYLPKVLENQLDELVRQIQQLKEEVDRCVKITLKSKDVDSASADLPNLVANEFLIVNPTADGVTIGGGSVATAAASSATPQDVGTSGGAAGSGTDFSRDDHVHDIGSASDLVADTTPQAGGDLDMNGQDLLIDSGNFIGDESGNEQIVFVTVASAVNHLQVTNAATGNHPVLASVGANTDIDIDITPKGTGRVHLNGPVVYSGDLDVNGNSIVSLSAGDIPITPDTTGEIILDGVKWPQADGDPGQFLITDGAGQLGYQHSGGAPVSTTTTNNTPFVIRSEAIPTDTAVMVHVEGVAINTDDFSNASGIEIHNLVLNDGGTVTEGSQLGDIVDNTPWALDINVVGNNATKEWEVVVTGIAGTNIDWDLNIYFEHTA